MPPLPLAFFTLVTITTLGTPVHTGEVNLLLELHRFVLANEFTNGSSTDVKLWTCYEMLYRAHNKLPPTIAECFMSFEVVVTLAGQSNLTITQRLTFKFGTQMFVADDFEVYPWDSKLERPLFRLKSEKIKSDYFYIKHVQSMPNYGPDYKMVHAGVKYRQHSSLSDEVGIALLDSKTEGWTERELSYNAVGYNTMSQEQPMYLTISYYGLKSKGRATMLQMKLSMSCPWHSFGCYCEVSCREDMENHQKCDKNGQRLCLDEYYPPPHYKDGDTEESGGRNCPEAVGACTVRCVTGDICDGCGKRLCPFGFYRKIYSATNNTCQPIKCSYWDIKPEPDHLIADFMPPTRCIASAKCKDTAWLHDALHAHYDCECDKKSNLTHFADCKLKHRVVIVDPEDMPAPPPFFVPPTTEAPPAINYPIVLRGGGAVAILLCIVLILLVGGVMSLSVTYVTKWRAEWGSLGHVAVRMQHCSEEEENTADATRCTSSIVNPSYDEGQSNSGH